MAMLHQQGETTGRARAPAGADQGTPWLDELDAVLRSLESLPAAARTALVTAIDGFAVEDGGLPPAAMRARELLLEPSHAEPAQSATAGGRSRRAPLLTPRRQPVPA